MSHCRETIQIFDLFDFYYCDYYITLTSFTLSMNRHNRRKTFQLAAQKKTKIEFQSRDTFFNRHINY